MKKSLFQRHHYEFLATLIRDIKWLDGYDDFVIKFTLALARDNPDFQSDKFIAAVYKKAAH